MEIHENKFHGDLQFKNGHKPIEHCCSEKNEKYSDRDKHTGGTQYRDEKNKEYTNIESFRNRTTLQEIEVKDNERKRKGNTLFLREEERIIKMIITRRKRREKNAKSRKQREPRGGDRKRTSSGNNPCIL